MPWYCNGRRTSDATYCYYLRADPAIECANESENETTPTAWLAVMIYPVGAFVLTALLLFAARRDIVSKRPTALSKALNASS